MNELNVFLLVVSSFVLQAACEDVLGCGGFMKSHVPIDFSKVEVKLLTKQGILKDKIHCAPNNGYYFVPVYDKGEYILELDPPPGWSFTPTNVELNIDGVNDLCSQGKDINFVFKGFGITGKVQSLGDSNGPEGVEVELKSNSQAESRKTLTTTNGDFFFTPVYPGSYQLIITKSKWKAFKDTVTVVVAEGNTELAPKSLLVQGYDVVGTVKNAGEPMKDTTILIFSMNSNNYVNQLEGCERSPVPGFPGEKKPICHVKTDQKGEYKFPVVPFGKYYVTPYYHGVNILYNPKSIEFSVSHDSVILSQNFEIVGFSVEGRVLKSPNGAPISNAQIFLNSEKITQTDSRGVYKLEKLKAGTYNLKAVVDGFQFKDEPLKINPNSKILPDIVPTAYKICGTVVSEKSQTVTFSQIGSTRILTTRSEPPSGAFCEYLSPAKYQVQVVISDAESNKGLQFFPKIENIEVSSEQASKIVFSQLKATIQGKVQCLHRNDCVAVKIVVNSLNNTAPNFEFTINPDNTYKIYDMNPGFYKFSLAENRFCWKTNKYVVNVNNAHVEVPDFVQSGYSVEFISSHDTQVAYKIPGQNKENQVPLGKGRTEHCLDKAGSYLFNLHSCHSYEQTSVSYDTSSGTNKIFLNALKHTNTLYIESDKKQGDVTAIVNIEGAKSKIGSLQYTKDGYEIKLLLNPGESAVIMPQSELLYFNPPILSIRGSTDCENFGPKFKGVLGFVFKGKITPPLAGVLVTIESDIADALMSETDEMGVYKFPPLDKSKTYKISAKKESYVLVGPDDKGDFKAHKLAEIVIEVLDKADKAPLQGTLLSLSGGESYRRNLQTDENGKITFHSLSPGEYFLRPMMKEYSFEPNSKIIKVIEGQTSEVQLIGTKVAFSAYGQVTSLNSEPEENILVVAEGTANCSQFSEDATSEASGHFRIRGLQPYCSYEISIKPSGSKQQSIERSAPKSLQVEKITEDIHDLRLVTFRAVSNLDLLVKVVSRNPEHYKTLRLKVFREVPSTYVVFSSRIETSSVAISADNNKGVLVHIPPIPIDGKTYTVLIESNLNNKLEPEPVYFVANSSFKYVELYFNVKSNATDQDIKQTSIWTLVLIFWIILVAYNIDKVSQVLKEKFGVHANELISSITRKTQAHDYSVDNDDIDQIVQSINAVKRKPKQKKN